MIHTGTVGKVARRLREATGMSRRVVSSKAGFNIDTLQNLEHGKDFRLSTLLALLEVLETPVTTFFHMCEDEAAGA